MKCLSFNSADKYEARGKYDFIAVKNISVPFKKIVDLEILLPIKDKVTKC